METRNTADLSLVESKVLNELEKCQHVTFTLKGYKSFPSYSEELIIMFVKILDLQLPPSQRAYYLPIHSRNQIFQNLEQQFHRRTSVKQNYLSTVAISSSNGRTAKAEQSP